MFGIKPNWHRELQKTKFILFCTQLTMYVHVQLASMPCIFQKSYFLFHKKCSVFFPLAENVSVISVICLPSDKQSTRPRWSVVVDSELRTQFKFKQMIAALIESCTSSIESSSDSTSRKVQLGTDAHIRHLRQVHLFTLTTTRLSKPKYGKLA